MKTQILSFALFAIALSCSGADAALRGGDGRKLLNARRELSSCSWYDPTCGHGAFTKKNAVGRAATALGNTLNAFGDCGIHLESCLESCFTPEHKDLLNDAVTKSKAVNFRVNMMASRTMTLARARMQDAAEALNTYQRQAGNPRIPGTSRTLHGVTCEQLQEPTNRYLRTAGDASYHRHSVGRVQVATKELCNAACADRADCAYAVFSTFHTRTFCNLFNVALECTPRPDHTRANIVHESLYVKDHHATLARLKRASRTQTAAFHGYAQQLTDLHRQATAAHAAVVRARAIVNHVEHNRCHVLVHEFEHLEQSAENLVQAVEHWVTTHECTLIDLGIDVAAAAFDSFYAFTIEPLTLPFTAPFCLAMNAPGAKAVKVAQFVAGHAVHEIGSAVVHGLVSVLDLPTEAEKFSDELIVDLGQAMLDFSCGWGAEGAWAILRPLVMCNIHVSGENCGVELDITCSA